MSYSRKLNCIKMYFVPLFILVISTSPAAARNLPGDCEELPSQVLVDILGHAFNSRYMSINAPKVEMVGTTGKRESSAVDAFYLPADYRRELSPQPAWEVSAFPTAPHTKRDKRAASDSRATEIWQCNAQLKWTDLGPDYFPRYLRSVECLRRSCFYGIYSCKPRAFALRLLRRKRGACVSGERLKALGLNSLPSDLKEVWVWEERTVNFCCDCAK